jgi:hypothetical protein
MNKNTLVIFLILFTIISCNVSAQSGVALDAWKKSKTIQEQETTGFVFVESTRGNDSYSGLSESLPKKTITAALAVVPASGTVKVMDKGIYEESFTIPDDVTLEAYNATIQGAVILSGGGRFYVNKHYASANDQTMLTKTGASHSYYQATNSWYNGYTGVTNIENDTPSSILFSKVVYMRVSGVGIRDLAPMTVLGGHIHFELQDLYLEADNAIALDAGNDESDLIGRIDHIRFRAPATTGLKAIEVSNGAKVELVAGDIDMPGNTAYEVIGSGSLTLNCLKITGTETGIVNKVMGSTYTYTKTEVDEHLGGLAADLAQGNRIYYCSSGTEVIGLATYGLLIQTLDPVETTTTIGPITSSTYAQYSPGRGRITPAAGIGVTTIPAGNFNRVSFMSNADTAGRSVTIQYALWRTDSAGTKIEQIATSTEHIIEALGASNIQRSDVIYAINSDVTTLATDRLMEEYWFKRSGTLTGTNPSIVRYVGGTHAGFVSFALPSGVVMLVNGTNADSQVTFPGDVDGQSFGAAQYIDLASPTSTPSWQAGRMFWDYDNQTIGMFSDQPDTILQVGQEFWARVKNEGVATLTNGQVVYLTPPTTGKDPVAVLADASVATQCSVLGVITHDLGPDETGFCTVLGLVRGLDTSAYTAGDKVYLSASSAGDFTATAPDAPNSVVCVGYIVKAHATAGVLYVKTCTSGSAISAVFRENVYIGGNLTASGTINGATTIASAAHVDQSIATHALLMATHGCAEIASSAYVDGRITEADASYTLSLGFTTDSVATHAALMSTHGATTIASQAYVDGRITETDASYTLSLSFTADSVATHALLIGTHGATTIASAAHVDQSIATHALLMTTHGCTEIASSAYVDQAIATAVAPLASFLRAEATIGGTATTTITFTTDIDGNAVAIASLSKTILVINGVMQSYSNFTKTNDTQLESTVGTIEAASKIILMQFD